MEDVPQETDTQKNNRTDTEYFRAAALMYAANMFRAVKDPRDFCRKDAIVQKNPDFRQIAVDTDDKVE